jgi:hypothetical protein
MLSRLFVQLFRDFGGGGGDVLSFFTTFIFVAAVTIKELQEFK